MNVKNLSKKILFSLATVLILNSCVEKIDLDNADSDITLNPSLALPIGSVHAKMLDLLDYVDSTYISADSTNAVCIVYSQKDVALEMKVDEFSTGKTTHTNIALKDEKIFQDLLALSGGSGITLPQGDYTFSRKTNYSFGFNANYDDKKVLLDSMMVMSAFVDLKLKTEGTQLSEDNYILMSLRFPNLLGEFDAQKLQNIKITNNDFSIKKEMEHFMVHFDKLDKDNKTEMIIDFTYVSNGTGLLSSETALMFDVQFNMINVEQVYGFIWQKEPIAKDHVSYAIPQDIFENALLSNSNLLFTNPQIDLSITTNVGIPLQLQVSDVYAIAKGEKINAEFNGENNLSIYLDKPSAPFKTTTTTLTLDRKNGSLHKLLSSLPEEINLDYAVNTPDDQSEVHSHFFTRPTITNLDIDIKLPLQFDPTTNFVYNDTLDADISSLVEDMGILSSIGIDTMNLYLDVNSMLPANAMIKLYYLDENDNVLFESKTFGIPSAQVDEEGRSIQATKETLVLSVNGDNIIDVYETKRIAFELAITGYDNNSRIYFQATDAIDIDLSVFVKANASINSSNQ